LACFGRVSQNYLLKYWDIENPVFVLEGDISTLLQNTKPDKQYRELPVFPGIQRDISILVDIKVNIAEVERLVRDKGGIYLREVKFYDLYQGKNIDKRKKSLTFNLVFQAVDRTLQDAEVDDIMVTIHKTLKDELEAQLR